MLSAMNCPDCDAPAEELPTSIDGHTFKCALHGIFAISGTAMALGFDDLDAWTKASALSRARLHMRPCDRIPIVTSYHL
jgi:hypothetical protein